MRAAIAEIRAVREASPTHALSTVQIAAIRYHLIVIGEAVHHLPETLRDHPVWRPYLELRNHLAHEYFRLDDAHILELAGDRLDVIQRAADDLLRDS